jgi:hypothetical protein
MRGKLAKSIRQYVKERYSFASTDPLYTQGANGVIMLAPQCQRSHYQRLKKTLMRQRSAS